MEFIQNRQNIFPGPFTSYPPLLIGDGKIEVGQFLHDMILLRNYETVVFVAGKAGTWVRGAVKRLTTGR